MNTQLIDRVIELTNIERSKMGLSPLKLDLKLTDIAQSHSKDMANNDYFSHTELDGTSLGNRVKQSGYNYSNVGENIAAGQTNAESVVRGWMSSSGHRANILNPNFTEIGIGYVFLENDTGNINYNHYWTQTFGNPIEKESNTSLDEINLVEESTNNLDPQNNYLLEFGTHQKDNITGTKENDLIRGRGGRDIIRGGEGNDILYGENNSDKIVGGSGNDLIVGGSGKDTLFGHTGNDTIRGGKGDDLLIGNSGKDILSGNNGRDTFVLESGKRKNNFITIKDYEDNFDKLGLSDNLSFNDLSISSTSDNTSTVIKEKNTNNPLAFLNNVAPSQIDPDDFIKL